MDVLQPVVERITATPSLKTVQDLMRENLAKFLPGVRPRWGVLLEEGTQVAWHPSSTAIVTNLATLKAKTNLPTGSPYTLHPTPYTLHASPFTLQPSHLSFHPSTFNFHLSHFTRHPSRYTLDHAPYTLTPNQLRGSAPRACAGTPSWASRCATCKART